MLDHARAIAQFAALERRTFPSGKDRIDHPNNGHDDLANSIAGAAVLASNDRVAKVPIISPVIVGLATPAVPGQSSTDLFYQNFGDRWR